MKRLLPYLLVVSISAVGASIRGASPQPSSGRPLTIDQLIDIRHPSNPAWSADGRQVTFTWERAGVATRYVSDLDGRPPRSIADPAPAGAGGRGRGGNAARADDGVASPERT